MTENNQNVINSNDLLIDHLKIKIHQDELLPEEVVKSNDPALLAESIIDLVSNQPVRLKIAFSPNTCLETIDIVKNVVLDYISRKVLVFRGSITDFIKDTLEIFVVHLETRGHYIYALS